MCIKEFRRISPQLRREDGWCVINTVYDDLKKALDNAPTIDAVEVVRCKDCKHTTRSKVSPEKIICCLTKMCGTVDPDYFCADGEREIDAEVENEQS